MRIANDIVDLMDINHRSGFAKRILSENEYSTYQKSSLSSIWHYWSAKETAYKFFKQKNESVKFLPKSYQLDEKLKTLSFKGNICNVHFIRNKSYIFCYSVDPMLTTNSYYRFVHLLEVIEHWEEKSIKIREATARYCLNHFKLNSLDKINFKKSGSGQPEIYYDNKKLPAKLSFTHHGRFIAVSILFI